MASGTPVPSAFVLGLSMLHVCADSAIARFVWFELAATKSPQLGHTDSIRVRRWLTQWCKNGIGWFADTGLLIWVTG